MRNAQPEPCRRRAIWAAQARVANEVQPEIRHEKDKARQDADAKTTSDAVLSQYLCKRCGKAKLPHAACENCGYVNPKITLNLGKGASD